jgi:hypothetical protein
MGQLLTLPLLDLIWWASDAPRRGEKSQQPTTQPIPVGSFETLQPRCAARLIYLCIVTGVGSLVMLSITEANANTPDPVCNVTLAYPLPIAVCPARFALRAACSPAMRRLIALSPIQLGR